MDQDGETQLTIHGLDEDNKLVRAEVLAQKLQALITGLRAADKHVNGTQAHAFIVTDMQVSSALVRVREVQRTRKPVRGSGIAAYEAGVRAIYNGDTAVGNLPQKLVRSVAALSAGASARFVHAEIGVGADVLRVDDYLLGQAKRAEITIEEVSERSRPKFFSGVAQSSFDGVLQLLDSRGVAMLAKLTTTAGRKEINCVVNKERVARLGDYFDKRVRLEGLAHYDEERPLPTRIDVSAIALIKPTADLSRWRGAFNATDGESIL